jgi:hypothetical protein
MSLIMDELVRVVRTATPCCCNASAKRAENVLSSYCLCRVATQAMLHVFVSVVHSGRSGRPAHFPGIVTGEPMPYNTTPPTTGPASPASSQDNLIPEQGIPALSPPPPSRPATPVVHRSPPPSSNNDAPSDEDDNDMPLGEGWFRSQPGMHRT